MPRTYTANMKAAMKLHNRAGIIVLADLELRDGSHYFWSTHAGKYPSVLGAGGDVDYSPWVISAGPFTLTRSLRADAGDLVIQNISGNSIERDAGQIFKAKELEGAVAVVRYWNSLAAEAYFSFYGRVTGPKRERTQITMQVKQLMDANPLQINIDTYSENCTLLYKGTRCGSTSAETSCDKTIPQCDVRLARARFNGIPTPPALSPLKDRGFGAGGHPVGPRGGGGDGPVRRPNLD